MAYGQPYGYQYQTYYQQPATDQMAQMRQNQMQQSMMAQPVQQENTGIIWVQGEAGAKAYLVAPGNTVQLWDSESQTIYLKSADMSGMPSMRVLDYTERTAPTPMRQNQKTAQNVDLSGFVTRDELEEILAERFKRSGKSAAKKEESDNA